MANNTAIASGNWENRLNWSAGTVPLATDAVVIPAGITITVAATGDVCGSLDIAASGSLSINKNENLSIGGNFTNAGTFGASAGSTVTFNGAANSVISGGGVYLIVGTIVLDMGSAATTLDIQDANFIKGINAGNYYYFTFIRGTWIMDNPATLNNCLNSGATRSLTIPYGVVIEAPNGKMNLAMFGYTDSVILSGELLLNGGTVTVELGQAENTGEDFRYTVNGGTPQLYISSGTLYVGAGFNALNTTDYIDFNMTGGMLILAYNGYSDWITFQLADNVGGKTFMSGGTIILQDACNAAIEDLDMGGANVAATLYSVTGGTIQLGYINTQSSSTYFGVDAQPATNYPNIQFESGVAKNVSAWIGGQINMLSLYINQNMTYDASGFSTTNIISTNGTFAFDDEGTYTTGSNTMEFSGSENQPITSTLLSNVSFYNLNIANTSGNVTLGLNATVNNQLSFTSGLLDASQKTLTLANGSVPITGASSTSYAIVGNGVSTTGNMTIDNLPAGTATAFPIGTASDYLPASINPVNANTNYSAYVFTGATTNGKSNGTPFSPALLSNMLNAVWNIGQTSGSGSATLTLDWTPAESSLEGTAFALSGTGIGIIQNTGGTTWSSPPSGTGNVATTYATASFNNFTQFAITDELFVLPVAVAEFNAVLNNNNTVGLSWSASDEMDISQFEVQRSTDGTTYSPIGTVQANNIQTGYSIIDPHPAAVNYYRLLTTINDGSTAYSPVRTIDLSTAVTMSVYPVPAATTVNVSVGNAAAGMSVRLINASGQVLQSSGTTGGSQVISIDISSYPAGTYFIQVIGENKIIQTTPLTKL